MFKCLECKTVLPLAGQVDDGLHVCPRCSNKYLVEVFPALLVKEDAAEAQSVLNKGESSCFYHSDKIAVQPCDHCGRLLCSLCRIPLSGHTLCPTCMAKGKDPVIASAALKSHTMHDSVALWVAVLSYFFGPAAIAISPVVYFLIIKNYRKDLGMVPRWKWRYWAAGIVATIPLAMGAFIFIFAGMI